MLILRPNPRPALRSLPATLLILIVIVLIAATSPVDAQETVTWTGGGANSFNLAEGDLGATATNPCNDENIDATFSNDAGTALTPFPGLTGGGTVPYMGMNTATLADTTTLQLDFANGLPVENLAFTIFDVDQNNTNGSSWTDEITVTASFGPTAMTITLSCAAGTCIFNTSGSGTTTAVATGDDNNPTFLNAPGQLAVSIPGPIDQVVVVYGNLGPGSNNQFVGFSDLTFDCSTVPVTVSRFSSKRVDDGLAIDWSTASEIGNIGFEVYGESARASGADAQAWNRLTEAVVPSPGIDSLEPRDYEVHIGSAANDLDRLLLAEINLRGKRRFHGPYTIGQTYGGRSTAQAIDWRSVRREMDNAQAMRRSHALAPGIGIDLDAGVDTGLDAKNRVVPNRHLTCELAINEDGIYRVTFDALSAAGCDFGGVPVGQMALTHRGQPVPIRVLSASKRFEPGSEIEFLGQAIDSLYTTRNVYRLTINPVAARRIEEVHQGISAPAVTQYEHSRWIETENHYSFASPTDDPWYSDALLAFTTPVSLSVPIEVDYFVEGSSAELMVDLWGVTDHAQVTPDHHVTIEVNGTPVSDFTFDGLTARDIRVPLTAGLIGEGVNSISLTLPGDTGAPFDLVHLDRVGFRYQRQAVADDSRLTFDSSAAALAVEGLASPEAIVYSSDRSEVASGVRRLAKLDIQPQGGGFRVEFAAETGTERRYWVGTKASRLEPEIVPARQPNHLFSQRAQYLIVSHSTFADSLQPLVAAKQRQGLATRVVEVEDLYAAYSGGIVDPEAIRSFLRDARQRLGTRFVLLVGGDSYDPLDHLGLGSVSFIPTLYTVTHPVVRHTPSDALLADVDDDQLPDLAIGRWPVRTLGELDQIMTKTLDYTADRSALFAADAHDGRVSFVDLSEQFATLLPAEWTAQRAYVDKVGFDGARQAVLDALATGVSLTSYIGHSSPMAWSFDNLLTDADARALPPIDSGSVVFAWGCWNGYHSVPQYNTLSHELLLSPGGAVALVGAAGLTEANSDRDLAIEVFAGLFDSGLTLGEALTEGKRRLANSATANDYRDVILGMTLLGDPALRLGD